MNWKSIPILVARYPDGEWSFALWEDSHVTLAVVEAKRIEAESRGCVLYREHYHGECDFPNPGNPREQVLPPEGIL